MTPLVRVDGSGAAEVVPAASIPVDTVNPSAHNETISAILISTGPKPESVSTSVMAHLPVSTVTWLELKPEVMARTAVLIDARSRALFDAGHIPGAVSLPVNELLDRLPRFTARYRKNTPLVVYCSTAACGLADAEGSALIEQFGFANVRVLLGGLAEWQTEEKATAMETGRGAN